MRGPDATEELRRELADWMRSGATLWPDELLLALIAVFEAFAAGYDWRASSAPVLELVRGAR